MVDVFISYSRSDQEKVGDIARMIAAEGYQVWWDADLPPHMSYGDVITAKIGAAKAAVVVWSHSAAASEWVRAEADVARNQKKLIQTALDDIIPPLPFNQIQCAMLGDWNGSPDHPGWRKVRESLIALCGPRGSDEGGEVTTALAFAQPAASWPSPQPSTPAAPPPAPAASRWPLLLGAGFLLLGTVAVTLWALDLTSQPAATATDAPAASTAAGGGSADVMTIEIPVTAVEYLPQSSTRPLTEDDISTLALNEIRIARNEIFARNGRSFRSPELVAHFSRFSWYRPTGFEVELTKIEQENVDFLKAAEERMQ